MTSSALERGLGARDKVRLDQYLEHVREIEGSASSAPRSRRRPRSRCPTAPVGIPDSWEEHATVMFDLMALAFEADLTRVFTFMLNREASQLVFPDLGFNEPWHHVSHHGNEPEKLALLVKLNTWQIELFGRFLERLQSTPDGDGTLLDHSVILWGSGMSDSNTHSPLDVPYLMVGKGAGRVHRQPAHRGAEGHAARQRDADRRAEVRRRRSISFGVSTGGVRAAESTRSGRQTREPIPLGSSRLLTLVH